MAMGMADDDPRVLVVVGLAHPELTGPAIRKRVARMRLHEMADPVAAMYAGMAAEKAGDVTTGVRFLASAIDGLREQVRLVPLTQAPRALCVGGDPRGRVAGCRRGRS